MKIRSVNGSAKAVVGCLFWLLLMVPLTATAIAEAVDETSALEQFHFDGLIQRAEVLARAPFEDDPLPEALLTLDYDRYGTLKPIFDSGFC
jgi:glucan biosynthesis protein